MKSVIPGIALTALLTLPASASAETIIDFNRTIRPILANNCFECHGPDEATREADLRLDLAEEALSVITKSNALESELYLRLIHEDPDEVMPPPKAHRHPNKDEIEQIRLWIEQGANWKQHWAFIPPERPEIPEKLSMPDWPRNDLDRLVLAHLDAEGLTPQPQARPEKLARRLALDLTGLPIELERVEQFLKAWDNDSEAAYEELVDDLLASPHYGEHMAWSWLDAARYADTNGFQGDRNRNMWRWRDWVIEAWNKNLPYDQFSILQLAGDLLLPKDRQRPKSGSVIREPQELNYFLASGFNRNNRLDFGSGTIQDEAFFTNTTDRAETTATVWMGLTMGCAKCHDHKFDPISMTDYYGMVAFFDQVEESGIAGYDNTHPYLILPTPEQLETLKEQDDNVTQAKAEFENLAQERKAKQRAWESTVRSLDTHIEPVPYGLAKDLVIHDTLQFDGETRIEHDEKFSAMMHVMKPWTLSISFSVEDPERNQAIFSVVNKPDRSRNGTQFDVIDGHLRLRYVTAWHYSYLEMTSKEPIEAGRKYQVSIVYDGSERRQAFQLFLNGKRNTFIAKNDINGGGRSPIKKPFVLGASPYNNKLRGTISNLRIYNRVLSAKEIAILNQPRTVHEIVKNSHNNRSKLEETLVTNAFLEDTMPNEFLAVRETLNERAEFIKTLPRSMVMIEKKNRTPSYERMRGAYNAIGEQVVPQTPSVLPPLANRPSSDRELNRLDFAHWLFQDNHPLTARVAVNRLWQQTWGRGFVRFPENFGIQAPEPKYRDVLDWLACEYKRLGWDTKAMLKTIVTSSAYRQDSNAPQALWKRDPRNQLLARGPRHRLTGPVIRDQALAIGGLLNNEIGGESIVIEQMTDPGAKEKIPPVDKNPHQRRTLYSWWKRNAAPPSMAIYDVNDRNACTVQLKRTNTPIQALATLNHDMFITAAREFAKKIIQQPESERITFAWQTVMSAKPSREEKRILKGALKRYQQSYNHETEFTKELVKIESSELAAWTTLANVLLNLDKALNKE